MNDRLSKFFGATVALAVTAFFGLCFYGWAMNIVKMVEIADQIITGMFIIRGIGILLAPLGVILGYI